MMQNKKYAGNFFLGVWSVGGVWGAVWGGGVHSFPSLYLLPDLQITETVNILVTCLRRRPKSTYVLFLFLFVGTDKSWPLPAGRTKNHVCQFIANSILKKVVKNINISFFSPTCIFFFFFSFRSATSIWEAAGFRPPLPTVIQPSSSGWPLDSSSANLAFKISHDGLKIEMMNESSSLSCRNFGRLFPNQKNL